MVNIFDFVDYRDFLMKWIQEQGEHRHGLKGKMANKLQISSSLLSQILKGDKSLTFDQSFLLSEFLGFEEIESNYLHLLIEKDRATHFRYKENLTNKITKLRREAQNLSKRISANKKLTPEQQVQFYSNWIYSAALNLIAIPRYNTVAELADYLKVDFEVAQNAILFLLEIGICVENKGKLEIGPTHIHLGKESPIVNIHHRNWRFQAIKKMDLDSESDLFFTGPMSLSKSAAQKIQNMLPQLIQEIMKISQPSDSEKVMCLNIDWFEF